MSASQHIHTLIELWGAFFCLVSIINASIKKITTKSHRQAGSTDGMPVLSDERRRAGMDVPWTRC